MGRRSKIDLLGLSERVIHLYNSEHKTLEEIEQILRSEDFDVSREAVRRVVKDSREVASQYQAALCETKVLIDTVRENPNTDVIEATTAILTQHLFSYIKSIQDFDFKDPGEVVAAVNRMAQAQTQIAKLRLTYQKGFDQAKKAILASLNDELKSHPDLLERLTLIVGSLEAKD
jgi:Zn-dependent M32 family carboxypeptidase